MLLLRVAENTNKEVLIAGLREQISELKRKTEVLQSALDELTDRPRPSLLSLKGLKKRVVPAAPRVERTDDSGPPIVDRVKTIMSDGRVRSVALVTKILSTDEHAVKRETVNSILHRGSGEGGQYVRLGQGRYQLRTGQLAIRSEERAT